MHKLDKTYLKTQTFEQADKTHLSDGDIAHL